MTASFCAICTSDRGPFAQRPLGRGDALVAVCSECDDEPAVTRHGPERGYEVPETERVSYVAIQAAAERAMGSTHETRQARRRGKSYAASASPGFIVVRVPRYRPGGDTIDAKEARDTLRGEPWFRDLRHLGSDRRYHLFERPDDRAAAAARSSNDNPLSAIEHLRVSGGGE